MALNLGFLTQKKGRRDSFAIRELEDKDCKEDSSSEEEEYSRMVDQLSATHDLGNFNKHFRS